MATLFAVLTLVFVIVRILPGDPAQLILGDQASREAIEALHARLGLDQPIPLQYLSFLANAVRGDWGVSMVTGQPVLAEVLNVLPWTIDLTLVSLALGLALGVPLGVWSAVRRNRFVDYVVRMASLAGLSFPAFVAAILLLFLFAIELRWFPVISARRGSLQAWTQSITLPAISLGLNSAAYITRVTRSAMLEVLSEDYVRTARAKGSPERTVVWRHALRNALIPIITVAELYMSTLIGNSVLTEIVFSRPGLGKLLVGALSQRDYTMLQGMMVIYTLAVVVVNLISDLAYGFVDPQGEARVSDALSAPTPRRAPTGLTTLLSAFNANKASWIGLAIVALVVAAALFAPLLAPYDPLEQDVLDRLKPPTADHLLGTDYYGRDTLSRLLYGARVSLVISLSATLIAMAAGAAIGMLAGWRGGHFDAVTMQAMDMLLAFPSLILGLMLVAMLGPSMLNIIAAIALTSLPTFARIARAPTIAMKGRDFIEACRALGFSDTRILCGHILPNIFPEILVMGTLWLANAIRTEASLAFIGLGLKPPTPTWGGMIREGFENILDSPWLAIVPSLAVLIVVFAVNLLGDGLRDAIDPKLRNET